MLRQLVPEIDKQYQSAEKGLLTLTFDVDIISVKGGYEVRTRVSL